jgi:hypothetical protein
MKISAIDQPAMDCVKVRTYRLLGSPVSRADYEWVAGKNMKGNSDAKRRGKYGADYYRA